MIKSLQDTFTLHNGVKMPGFGLGVYKTADGEEVINAIKYAVKAGYRAIDTAALYFNEDGVGEGIKQCGLPREEIFVTTKVWNSDQGYDATLAAFEKSRKKLDVDYVDLYLIHWPVKEKYKETWRAMEELYRSGKVRAIGVSNFHQHHLEDLMTTAKIKPMVNQIELHPMLSQVGLRDYCHSQNIAVTAWSPLAKGRLMEDPVLVEIAKRHNKTVAQVILRWHVQNGVIVIPKSTHEHRIVENADIFDFTLDEADMKAINALNINERLGQNPDNFHFDF
ncbi:aldo/keto reductase [Bacillus sp. AGMB 02131]|uniref:Aldo/keto reductase n=1 Tax=Peribacillus faecalis TaxID=2772559 RepID=A0A927HB28_9BACI|nr:aldo/keto reductase [Peribacillus faecalis]MBD3106973.1 aldo/keto reductase [Peribacillus faecalis]